MKSIFGIFLIVQALIHVIGFAKAFQLSEIEQLTQSVSKPIGVLWLVAALLFVLSTTLVFLKKDWWFIIAGISIILSQILIIMFWKDAKFGTIVNIIILLVSISAFGNHQFNKMLKQESSQLIQDIKIENLAIISKKDISHLPKIVQKWMCNSGVVGKTKVVSVRLKQKGAMKTKPQSKWMAFSAKQYFDVKNPAFIWSTKVDFLPIIKMVGRDKFTNGEGEMLIKLASIIPVVDEAKNEKINSSTMIRYMAEMTWFPSAALENYMTWEGIDSTSAKAIFTFKGKAVSGVFKFSEDGEMRSFEAQRYYNSGKDATLETWFVTTKAYKNFDGFKIPSKCSAIWKLKEGDFNWLDFEISDVEYNIINLYKSMSN